MFRFYSDFGQLRTRNLTLFPFSDFTNSIIIDNEIKTVKKPNNGGITQFGSNPNILKLKLKYNFWIVYAYAHHHNNNTQLKKYIEEEKYGNKKFNPILLFIQFIENSMHLTLILLWQNK